MRQEYSARILRVHVSEADRHGGRPLHEAIVATCREMGVAGATVFRGLEGYGETGGLHAGREQPLVVMVVDRPAKIEELMAALEPMLQTGVLAASDVRVIRVEK